jgi:hypothetical protein
MAGLACRSEMVRARRMILIYVRLLQLRYLTPLSKKMYKKSQVLIFILYGFNILTLFFGGMSLNAVRVIQWLVGAVLLVYGIYLIFGVQEFFGTLAIIVAFLIFPSLRKGQNRSYSNDYIPDSNYDTDNSDNSEDLNDGDNSGGDSDGNGGSGD